MQEFYLRDYDVNLKFPDGMSEKRIKGIIERDYPEPDEKLVARFENPDTPASSLSKEDHERYLQARPEMTAGRFAGMAADAFTSTAGRLLTNLPEFLKTFAMSPIEMGVSARTLAEGFARGTYDTETMGRMAEGYLMSKVEGFGGRTNDEKENQYRRFLKVKELQNVRSKIDKGDQSAWNEYMEWAGANGAKIDPEKFNQGAAEFLGEFADPSLLIPGSKIGTAIAKTTGRVTGGAVSAAGDMMSAGGRRLSDLRSSATDAMGNLASKVDEASGGLGRYAVPGGVGAAVGVGALDLGTAGMGTLAVAGIPAAMEVAGGLLRNFGDAMKVNPTRSGGLARMALNSPDTAAGYLAGKLQFLDTPTNYAGRAASGAVTGVGIGAGIGLATGGVEGLAQGIGSGGAMGAFGGTMGRFVEGATGAAKRAAQDSDLVTWLESKSDEDRASLGRYKTRDDLIRAMDLEQVILGSTSEAEPIIRYGTDETVIGQDAQGKDITLKGGGGAYTQEGGRPVIHLNTNSDLRTLAHETFHAIARIDGFEVMVQRIKDQVGKLYKDQEIDTLINDYEKSGKLLVTDDTPGKSDRDKKFNSILEEIGAEYFANYIKGKDSNYLFKGNPIREAIRGITDRFVAGKLDRVHNTFKSDIFDTPIKQSKALNRSIDDLVRARRRSKRNINLSVDTPVRVYSDFDLKDDAIFQELVDMGAARVTATGKREMIKTDYQVKKIEAERAKTMAKVLDSVDDTGGLIRDERGNYSGLRFSKQQIDALLASDAITGTLRKALEKIKEMPDDSGLMNVLYAAATTKTKKGSRYRNLPLSNRDAILFNFIISPQTRTMRVKVVDKTLLDQRVAKEFANPETQKEFGSMEEMQRDLLTYLNALSSGQTPTAEVLGSAKKRDILNKVLKVRNQKGNPLVPEGTKFNEAKNDHPWRDFRLDRIVQMTTRETKVNFSEDAYNRARVNFRPRTFEPGQTTVLKPADLARFSPSPDNPNIDLRDLNNKKIQVLTTDSSGARDRNANGVAVQFRGGPGHLALYDGWGFTNINSAKAFITRLRRDGFPLVGITSMKPNNHLNSKLARRYYGLKWEELVETGKVTAREANKHIKEAMKRIINSKAGKSPLTKQQMSTIAGIKTYKDFARVFEEIPWKAAPVLYTKLDGKTLPIKQSRLKELGMDLETIANELREPAYEGIGPGTLLAIAEYGGKPPEYRPELNENYPYFVGLKEKAFLKEFTEVTNLTSRKDVATKSGKPNSAVLMGAGVVLDKLASGEVRFSPERMDAEHAKAIDSGDTAVARKLVDNAANKAGFTVKVKRGDGKAFNRFDKSRRGESTKALSAKKAFFFTDSESAAGTFARMSSNNEAETVLRADQKGIQAKIDELQPQAFKDIEQALNDPQTDIEPYVREWGKKLLRKNTLHRIPLTVVSNSNFFNSPAVKEWYDASISRVDEQTPSWLAERERTKKKIGLSEDGVVREFFLNLNNYDVIDYGGKTSRLGPTTYSDAIDKALAAGKDGVVFKNTEDAGEVINIYATFEPNQAKSADLATYDNEGNLIPLSQRFNKQSDDIRFSPQRELDSLGMYSKAQEAIEGMQQKRGTGQQFLKAMEKAGVKSEEIEDIGLDTFLKDNPKTTQEEVLDFIKSNQIEMVEVEAGTPEGYVVMDREGGNLFDDTIYKDYAEAVEARDQVYDFWARDNDDYYITSAKDLSESTKKYYDDWELEDDQYVIQIVDDPINFLDTYDGIVFSSRERAESALDTYLSEEFKERFVVEEPDLEDITKYSEYVEPGAMPETYTERLLTLPYGNRFGHYDSSHFDQGNIIAHVRHNDRIGPDGEKILFLEEIQSDWHQEGRESGYTRPSFKTRNTRSGNFGPSFDTRLEAERYAANFERLGQEVQVIEGSAGRTPNAPFKKSWPEFSMKRMLKLAADEGYDAIAWTRGDTQNARYDLGDKITGLDLIEYDDGTYELMVRMPNEDVFKTVEHGITKDKLPDHIGKELTKRALANMGDFDGGMRSAVLEGENLRLGGKGMRGFYDDKLPKLKVFKQTKDANGKPLKVETKAISDDLEANYVALDDTVRSKISSQGLPRYSPARTVTETYNKLIDSNKVKKLTGKDLVGMKLFPIKADLTAAGDVYSGIDSSDIVVPIELKGGPYFPLIKGMEKAGLAWANKGPGVSKIKSRMAKDEVYGVVVSMTPQSHKSNTDVSDAISQTVVAYIKSGRVDPQKLESLNKEFSEWEMVMGKGKNKSLVFPDFPGLKNPEELLKYLNDLPFEKRAMFANKIDQAKFVEAGFPRISRILDATIQPEFRGQPNGQALLILKLDPAGDVVKLGEKGIPNHRSYDFAVKGKLVGVLEKPISAEKLFPDHYAKRGKQSYYTLDRDWPVTSVTEKVAEKFGVERFKHIKNPAQANAILQGAIGDWYEVPKTGKGSADFSLAIGEAYASPTVKPIGKKEARDMVKSGQIRVFQLGSDRSSKIFFALKSTDDGAGLEIVNPINNEPGTSGADMPSILIKAIEEGATEIKTFSIPTKENPKGARVDAIESFGFKEVARLPFEAQESGVSKIELADMMRVWESQGWNKTDKMPDIVQLSYEGTIDDRRRIRQRYLQQDSSDLANSTLVKLDEAGEEQRLADGRKGSRKRRGPGNNPRKTAGNKKRNDASMDGDNEPLRSRYNAVLEEIQSLGPDDADNLRISEDLRKLARKSLPGIKFSPERKLNDRGGAVYSNGYKFRAVQTSSRAGVRVYSDKGRRIGPVFNSVEKAQDHLERLMNN